MIENHYEHKKYIRIAEFGGKTQRYKCRECPLSTKTYRGIQSHISRHHTKQNETRQPFKEQTEKIRPQEQRKEVVPTSLPPMQPCPHCGHMIPVPSNTDRTICTNGNCKEELLIVDGKIQRWHEYHDWSNCFPV